jgi:hypothetical protein
MGCRFVGEAALTTRIKAARRALGDDGEASGSSAPSAAGGPVPGAGNRIRVPEQRIAFTR